VRRRNRDWLVKWEPRRPVGAADVVESRSAFAARCRARDRERQLGNGYGYGIFVDNRLVGEINMNGVQRSPFQSAYVGYWIDEAHAGRGVTPTALALAVDHCYGPVGLHRIQADVRPENTASRRVVEKLGFRQEAFYLRYLDIDGAYRDHLGFALTIEDVPGGLVRRLPRS